ncbi:ROK family protein [Psychrobacillus sp. NEAU-3TGS]|uniref:ROK family protein n=1 Tax=Psychrobacillus sp. NEAU-3TGS TaxID=2995412 RepID=UPI0024990F6A|nr:ROK family protein [Psychrobacillus sp. NEAU-3TGS]MDI2586966.1 ROK family protein [Psychrobacillus sp. NEAU-3TGS]
MGYILAADIGGTKLATALFKNDGTVVKTNESLSEKKDEELLFQCLVNSFRSLCINEGVNFDDINGIAVGIPGIVDAEKGIAVFQNNLPWRDFPLVERLESEFPQSKIMMDNDVYMATWGEYTTRGFSSETMVYVTLSTGISCCLIHQGLFLRGSGMAGEIGFSLTGTSDTSLETLVSGPALELKGRKQFNNPELSLKEMMVGYYQGNVHIARIINEAVTALAKEVYQILVFTDPHCIVLGGGVFNHHPTLIEAVRKEVGQYLSHPLLKGKEERIEASIYKGEAGIRGAASRIINIK